MTNFFTKIDSSLDHLIFLRLHQRYHTLANSAPEKTEESLANDYFSASLYTHVGKCQVREDRGRAVPPLSHYTVSPVCAIINLNFQDVITKLPNDIFSYLSFCLGGQWDRSYLKEKKLENIKPAYRMKTKNDVSKSKHLVDLGTMYLSNSIRTTS